MRRYVVKEVASSPGWTGCLWAVGCKYMASAMRLFEQKSVDYQAGGGAALLLIDRQKRVVLRSRGSEIRRRRRNTSDGSPIYILKILNNVGSRRMR